ncbi:MAG: hypothetical protein Q8S57_03280 [Methanoregula sp.]|nr:hypothetical protein [Methanoregula sp.]
MDDGETIRVIPVPDDPIPSLRGRGRGQKTTERLLAERKKDRDREASDAGKRSSVEALPFKPVNGAKRK